MQRFPIHYIEPVFRPPSEAHSLILPVTDRWSGSGELPHEHGRPPVPERLAPGSAPIEPRTGEP